MHKVPTTLLHSLEGMPGLDWEKLLILQSQDGSFLFSPSSTAFALMQTKDENCLGYLKKAVHRFNGGGNCKLPFYPSIAKQTKQK
jgi:ent-copalyl diphosphate synthase